MKALILSGGTGSRLRPITYTNAKQLIPVANKPILFYIIDKVVDAGIKDIGIIVGDSHMDIKLAAGNGDRWNAKITYIHQPIPLGLAHAVKTAEWFIEDSDFLMILGDNLFQMDLTDLINNFYDNKANASLMLHKVDSPSQFGVAVVKDGSIERLAEKPAEFISDLIITGVYIFDRSIFNSINKIQPSARGELEITDAIQNLLETGGKVTYSLAKGWWKDTGKLEDLLEANKFTLDDVEAHLGTALDESNEVTGKLDIGKNVEIKNSILHGPVAISDDVKINNCYIGPYTSINKRVELYNVKIQNSIILSDSILENIELPITNSLLGKKVLIKGKCENPSKISLLLGDNSELWTI